MDCKFNTADALGNEIQMGENYGYSSSDNGLTKVRLGKAIEFTPKGLLTIELYQSKSGIYNDELTDDPINKKSISVKPSALFPVFNRVFCVSEHNKGWDNENGVDLEYFSMEDDAKIYQYQRERREKRLRIGYRSEFKTRKINIK